MPATAADYFGTANAGAIYGAMIVAWSAGGVIGPLAAARLYESSGGYAVPFTVLGIIALVSLVLPVLARPPQGPPPATVDLRDAEVSARRRSGRRAAG
jgi:OFA family oxalate/formate antiporter-like MFS transporter